MRRAGWIAAVVLCGVVAIAQDESPTSDEIVIDTEAIKTLTPELARTLTQQFEKLHLDNLTKISPEAATALANHKGYLSLNGLATLSDEAAKALAQHKGYHLSLDGLTSLSSAALAAKLVQQAGPDSSLSLESLTTLSDEAAKALARHKGDLHLNRLTTLTSPELAAKLVRQAGSDQGLHLSSLTKISPEAAKALAQHKGESLALDGLTTLSDEVAKALAQHKGNLYLNGLSTLTNAELAAKLVRQAGANRHLELNGLTTISPESANAVAQHKGNLSLNGLTTISPEIAKALALHEGWLDLNGLTTLSDEAGKAIAQHKGNWLHLYGLTMLSDEAAKALGARAAGTALSKQAEQKVDAARRMAEEATRLAEEQRKQEKEAAERLAAKERREAFLPKWADYEDLNQLLERFDPSVHSQPLGMFVRFGSAELAEKVAKGDRFDREEASDAARTHREGLRQRKFLWQAKYSWDEREPSPGKERTVRLRVPLDLRCFAPPRDADIGVANYSEWPLWYLTKDRTLKPCANNADVRQVLDAKGILYAPENHLRSELVLWVGGQREVQKSLAREPDQHVVNIGFTQLGMERPTTVGFYKVDAIRMSDFASSSLLIAFENGNNGPEDQPNYFVTKSLGPGNDRSIPEVVSAWVEKVEVVNVAGKERRVVFSWSRE